VYRLRLLDESHLHTHFQQLQLIQREIHSQHSSRPIILSSDLQKRIRLRLFSRAQAKLGQGLESIVGSSLQDKEPW
jgi:hypothetical protein